MMIKHFRLGDWISKKLSRDNGRADSADGRTESAQDGSDRYYTGKG